MPQPQNSARPLGVGAPAAPRPMSMPKVAFASFIGAMLEWYDFFLFGTASALIFGPLFFPTTNHLISTAAAFAVFGVGFVMRPVGGLFFGHFGDRFGRKATLVATLLIIGIGTFVIGLLPTYARIGVWAPIALIAMRLVQGSQPDDRTPASEADFSIGRGGMWVPYRPLQFVGELSGGAPPHLLYLGRP